jgi:hypothetical protein
MDVLNLASIDNLTDFAVLITSFVVLGAVCAFGIYGIYFFPARKK